MISFLDTGRASVGANPLAYFNRLAGKTRAVYEAQFAKDTSVQREIEHFRAQSAKARTPDDLLNNYRALAVATSAFGLEDALESGFRTRAIAKSDARDPNSVLNKFSDLRYRELNLAFEFASQGVTKLQSADTQELIERRYITNEYERSLERIDPLLRDAAYFVRRIGSVTSINTLISDQTLFGVVIDTLGISRAATGGNFENLKARIERGFDLNRINDTAYVEKFAQRFLAIRSSQQALSAGSPLVGLFFRADA